MRGKTAIVLLAAGESSRLGEAKQLLDVDGEPLVRRVARQLVELDAGQVAVVIGSRGDAVADALAGMAASILVNVAWRGGIGTSIAAGVRWANGDSSVTAVMIVLCDQPAIGSAHYQRLVQASTTAEIAATEYAGTVGVPAVYSRTLFDRLMALPPDRGAKSLLDDPSLRIERVRCESAGIDLDTPADVQRWRGL